MRRHSIPTLLSLLLVATSACVVGEPGAPPGGDDDVEDPQVDAGTNNNNPTCEPASTALPNGMHNPGQPCLNCHTGAAGAPPKWTLAGTLFAGATSTTPVVGATIIVTDANNTTVKLITASNGNFYTAQALTAPFKVRASKCPETDKSMTASAGANCNSCHGASGTPGRIHLP